MLTAKRIDTDLCVVGGGIAGMCAAISAARNGIKVVLMHERPVLGGNASSEIRMWVCGANGRDNRETGIFEEISLENYYRNPTKNYYIWDTVLYDFVIREENITLLLNCTCMDADTDNGDFADGRSVKITKVRGYQMTTQMFFDVYAKNYADCSGDSILAPLTGAEFSLGRESKDMYGEPTHVEKPDDLTMGMSCLIQGRETDNKIRFTPPSWSTPLNAEHFKERCPDLYSEYENFWYLELGGNRDTIGETEEITRELIPLATGTWDYIKNSGEFNADNWELDFLGFLAGKRESRRMTGEYVITANDIMENKQYEDTIAYGGWTLDDHFPDGFYHKGTPNTNIHTPAPYCLPYRALYSKNVENLFFAGRNISMTHTAMSSIRVMATCGLLGEAVGAAAAISSKYGLTPNGVYKEKLAMLQDMLLKADCFLPDRTRSISELCKNTPVLNGSDTLKDGRDRVHDIYGGGECGVLVKNGTLLKYEFDSYKSISSVHICFDSDLNRETLPGGWCERTHTMRCNTLKDSPQFYLPKTLCKNFYVEIETKNCKKRILDVDCNLKRCYDIKIDDEVKSITLAANSNWGETDSTRVFSFDF